MQHVPCDAGSQTAPNQADGRRQSPRQCCASHQRRNEATARTAAHNCPSPRGAYTGFKDRAGKEWRCCVACVQRLCAARESCGVAARARSLKGARNESRAFLIPSRPPAARDKNKQRRRLFAKPCFTAAAPLGQCVHCRAKLPLAKGRVHIANSEGPKKSDVAASHAFSQ